MTGLLHPICSCTNWKEGSRQDVIPVFVSSSWFLEKKKANQVPQSQQEEHFPPNISYNWDIEFRKLAQLEAF